MKTTYEENRCYINRKNFIQNVLRTRRNNSYLEYNRHQYNKIEIGVFFFHETGVIRRETENKRDCLSRLIAFCNH